MHVSGCKDLLARLLTVKPRDRITIEEIMKHPWIADVDGPLQTHVRPETSIDDDSLHYRVVQALSKLGISSSQVDTALETTACNDVFATYKFMEMKLRKFNVKRRILPRTQSDNSLPRRAEIEYVPDNKQLSRSPGVRVSLVVESIMLILLSRSIRHPY